MLHPLGLPPGWRHTCRHDEAAGAPGRRLGLWGFEPMAPGNSQWAKSVDRSYCFGPVLDTSRVGWVIIKSTHKRGQHIVTKNCLGMTYLTYPYFEDIPTRVCYLDTVGEWAIWPSQGMNPIILSCSFKQAMQHCNINTLVPICYVCWFLNPSNSSYNHHKICLT